MAITDEQIESAIEAAIKQVKDFTGSRDTLIKQVIKPLQAKLRQGIAAGLSGNAQQTNPQWQRLSKALKGFDERLRTANAAGRRGL